MKTCKTCAKSEIIDGARVCQKHCTKVADVMSCGEYSPRFAHTPDVPPRMTEKYYYQMISCKDEHKIHIEYNARIPVGAFVNKLGNRLEFIPCRYDKEIPGLVMIAGHEIQIPSKLNVVATDLADTADGRKIYGDVFLVKFDGVDISGLTESEHTRYCKFAFRSMAENVLKLLTGGIV